MMLLKLLPSGCHPGKTKVMPEEFGQNPFFSLLCFRCIGDVTFGTMQQLRIKLLWERGEQLLTD